MTPAQFVAKIREIAKEQKRPVLAVDFEPKDGGLMLSFRFKP